MSGRAGITAQVLALAVLASCGGVQASDPPDAAAEVLGQVDTAAEVLGQVDTAAEVLGQVDTAAEILGQVDAAAEVLSQVASCATSPPPLVGVDEAQCASDCHSALCTMGGVRFVGCKRSTTSTGLPAQFYCGADFVTPTCVEACP